MNRIDRKEKKHEEAQVRNDGWASLTPQQQLDALDSRLGKGVGAVKQRAKLQSKINGDNQ